MTKPKKTIDTPDDPCTTCGGVQRFNKSLKCVNCVRTNSHRVGEMPVQSETHKPYRASVLPHEPWVMQRAKYEDV